jgi:DNA-binding response OmpR family regulator
MKKNIIVDVDLNIIRLLEVQLSSWGYTVMTCPNSLDCLDMVTEHKPDLILLDIMMPGLDGVCLCSELTTSFDIPVIMVSALQDSKTKRDLKFMGAYDYITKPIDMDDLKTKLQKALCH